MIENTGQCLEIVFFFLEHVGSWIKEDTLWLDINVKTLKPTSGSVKNYVFIVIALCEVHTRTQRLLKIFHDKHSNTVRHFSSQICLILLKIEDFFFLSDVIHVRIVFVVH